MNREKIVVIEDEPNILEIIDYNLSREGYSVFCCRDGEEGLRTVREENPELVLLDLMLPDVDGVEVCRAMRSDPSTANISIIMVTAKGEESDVVLGLGVGADDYVRKPFGTKELIARVKAALRRIRMREELSAADRLVRGPIVIDVTRHGLRVDGRSVTVTPTELRLVHYLASHPGRVFTRDELLNHSIGGDAVVTDRNIDVHVRSIRKKLGDYSDLIETVRGVGYRFREDAA